MTETQTFIEDAIKGGWEPYNGFHPEDIATLYPADAMLDIEVWQAVGKTRGWDMPITEQDIKDGTTLRRMWQVMMNTFIGGIQDGLSIEDSLTKLK